MKKNKKAVSVLIATVMVILITMVAVGIVWQIVIPLIKTSMEVSKLCSDAQLMINRESGYTFYDENLVSVMVSRGEIEVGELDGVQIKVLFDGKSKTFDTRYEKDEVLLPADPADHRDVPGINAEWTYTINRTEIDGTPSAVAIAAILRIGAKDHVCQMTPTVRLEVA